VKKTIDSEEKFNFAAFTGPQNVRERFYKVKSRESKRFNHTTTSLLSEGMMMGEDDAVLMQKYSKTVWCNSQRGTVLWMNMTDFLQRVKNNEETWKLIENNTKLRVG
jgi:hypothetical protein